MNVAPFKPSDLDLIELQPAQAGSLERAPADYAEQLAAAGPAVTVRDGARVVACLGVGRPAGAERLAWCFLAAHLPPCGVFRAAQAFLAEHAGEALYATCEADHAAGARALRMLGFREDPHSPRLPAFGFDGRDHTLFVRAAA
jgi:hypothetical protein